MPRIRVVFYCDERGRAPAAEWLRALRDTDRKAYAKCAARIRVLAELGHELRRPIADYLRDGVYELRVKHGHVNYRLLYFFHGKAVAVVAHALTKEDEVPDADIERAITRKRAFERDPQKHACAEENAARKPRTDALRILDQITGDDPELRELIHQETINVRVAKLIYEARIRASLTQQELAQRIGTRQPVIARLEDADYQGHSLTMLQRIAGVLNLTLDIRFVPSCVPCRRSTQA